MRWLLRNILVHAFALYLLSQLLSGVVVTGGVFSFILAGLLLTIMSITIRPILSFFAIPFNIVTFGLFSVIINALILYLLTLFVSSLAIDAFVFEGYSLFGFVIPEITFNRFFAYIAASVVLSTITGFIEWLMG